MAQIISVLFLILSILPANAASPEASAHSIAVFNLANGDDYRGAIALHESKFEQYKSELIKNKEYTFAVAVAYQELGNWERALEFYKLSLSVDKDKYAKPILLERIGEAQLHLGAIDEAEANYKEAYKLAVEVLVDPNDHNVARIRAGLYRFALLRGDWSTAFNGLQAEAAGKNDSPEIIKGNPFADEGYEDWFKSNRWIYEGIAKSAWELAKAPGSDQAALRAAGFDAVQWLQRSKASEAMAQTVARISAGESGSGTLRTLQDWRDLYKKASEDSWSGKSLAQYRQQLAESPAFQAEVQRVSQEYYARLSGSNAAADGAAQGPRALDAAQAILEEQREKVRQIYETTASQPNSPEDIETLKRRAFEAAQASAAQAVAEGLTPEDFAPGLARPAATGGAAQEQRAIEAAQAAGAQAAAEDQALNCHFMDEREACRRTRERAMNATPALTTDYLGVEMQRQAADTAKQKLDEINRATSDDRSFLLWLEQKVETHLDATLSGKESGEAAKQAMKSEALTDRAPLKEAEVMGLLGDSKAIVTYLIGEKESFVWALTSSGASWASIPITRQALEDKLAILRCGLEDKTQLEFSAKCAAPLGIEQIPGPDDPLPFSFAIAHELYAALFGPIEGILKGKELIIVPTGALLSLPFQVLLPEAPSKPVGTAYSDYAGIAWFGRSHVISILPSVPMLKLLVQFGAKSRGSEPYLGFGDPSLKGDGACPANPPVDAQSYCGAEDGGKQQGGPRHTRARVASRSPRLDDVFQSKQRSPHEVAEAVKTLCPLPETAAELRCVARSMKVPESDLRLSSSATEAEIKSMSASGALAKYQLVHFATHGLLSGDVAVMAGRNAEPALVMSPPSSSPENDDDDGLLTASEISRLKFNADLIILSACNTAAGQDPHADALSGLARAFFYGGTRSLLVSNWPVDSDVAARLVTEAFHIVEDSGGKVGYAAALAKATGEIIDDPSATYNVHPSVWGPFVVIGLN